MQALVNYMSSTGMSQVDLATRIGVNQSQINHWLKGTRLPNAKNLKLIWKKTGISLEKLVEDL